MCLRFSTIKIYLKKQNGGSGGGYFSKIVSLKLSQNAFGSRGEIAEQSQGMRSSGKRRGLRRGWLCSYHTGAGAREGKLQAALSGRGMRPPASLGWLLELGQVPDLWGPVEVPSLQPQRSSGCLTPPTFN